MRDHRAPAPAHRPIVATILVVPEVVGARRHRRRRNYLEWCRHAHHEPMSEKAFWRDQSNRQDRNPQARCC
ncbi:hypothetical protein PH31N_08358 [Cutibacterium modestum 31N]|nr:hypothetical protein [Cutibacterium modestum 31N]